MDNLTNTYRKLSKENRKYNILMPIFFIGMLCLAPACIVLPLIITEIKDNLATACLIGSVYAVLMFLGFDALNRMEKNIRELTEQKNRELNEAAKAEHAKWI